jgi:hypothetical protein
MKRLLFNLTLITSLVLGPGLLSVKAENKELEAQVHDVNQAANKSGKMSMALDRISTETGIPRDQVQSLHKRYDDVGPGGLMVVGVIADETKKSPQDLLEKHKNGKSWTALARDNNVPVERLNERLDRFQRALAEGQAAAGTTSETKTKHKKD